MLGPGHERVDAVARRAGDLGDDAAVGPDEPVEQGRLPHVRSADDREPRLGGLLGRIRRVGQQLEQAVQQVADPLPVQGRHREGLAEPEPDTARSRPRRRRGRPPCSRRPAPAPALVRRRRASAASSSVIPACTSTTSTTRSAASIDRSACAAASASTPVARWRYPAVSTSPNRRPRHVASSSIRSRVTPGWPCAIAARLPNKPVHEGGLADVLAADDRDLRDARAHRSVPGQTRTSGRRSGHRERGVESRRRRVDHHGIRRRLERVGPGVPGVALARSRSAHRACVRRVRARRAGALRARRRRAGTASRVRRGRRRCAMSRPSITAPVGAERPLHVAHQRAARRGGARPRTPLDSTSVGRELVVDVALDLELGWVLHPEG